MFTNIFYVPVLVLKGIDFTTGHIFSFFPGGKNAKGSGDMGPRRLVGFSLVPFEFRRRLLARQGSAGLAQVPGLRAHGAGGATRRVRRVGLLCVLR